YRYFALHQGWEEVERGVIYNHDVARLCYLVDLLGVLLVECLVLCEQLMRLEVSEIIRERNFVHHVVPELLIVWVVEHFDVDDVGDGEELSGEPRLSLGK